MTNPWLIVACALIFGLGQALSVVSLFILHRTAQGRSEPANQKIAAERRTSTWAPTVFAQDARLIAWAISLGGRAATLGKLAHIGRVLSYVSLAGMLVRIVFIVVQDYLSF
ncbi:hypothetical protein C7S18_20860 [Ahniella affigens]|uniref:Uncharacterized protein n=1 Tax=Ahniella affigens TaxID=2021234 RepID=A0A2P1PXB6_9GAMM|nr:hypothetical protein [Ahniella affigens]AVP99470.1 hypothetical protein C7S18_20860 [Ahniella affigens]